MNRLDRSLDDMIKADKMTFKQQKKKVNNKTKQDNKASPSTNTPKTSFKTGKVAKTAFQHKKNKKANKALSRSPSLDGIYTSHYGISTEQIKLTTINNNTMPSSKVDIPTNTPKRIQKTRKQNYTHAKLTTSRNSPNAQTNTLTPKVENKNIDTLDLSDDIDDLESMYEPLTYSSDSSSNSDELPEPPHTPPNTYIHATTEANLMDIDNEMISFRRDNIISQEMKIKKDEDPTTIEIENLDPCTTADDVKMVCSRFGNIKSCICSGGYAQVTYTNKADGMKAIMGLDGKVTDN
ncbi:hypothetical protein BGZ49_006223, partial [Haplosporangium sp. Z 27]